MPSEISGERVLLLKKIFIDKTPKGNSLSQTTSFEAQDWHIDQRVPEEDRDKKSKKKKNWGERCNFTIMGRRTPQGDCYASWFIT
jgi:hypothetical protein